MLSSSLPERYSGQQKEYLSRDSQFCASRLKSSQASLSERKFCRSTISRTWKRSARCHVRIRHIGPTTRKDARRRRAFLYSFYQEAVCRRASREIPTVTDVQ